MIKAVKIRLLPTIDQETLFKKSAGAARWAYNYFINVNNNAYEAYLANNKNGKSFISENQVRKEITILKNTTHPWLKEISCNVVKQAIKDANIAYQRFFKGLSDKPKCKCRHKADPSF